MGEIYRDYSRARIGWFLGLTGWQAGVVAGSTLPVFAAVRAQAWASAAVLTGISAIVIVLTVLPVRGRSAVGWLLATTGFAAGGLAGWSRFTARAATGQAADLDTVDLPGALAGIEIHEGPPTGITGARVAIIQNHATRTWAVTAAIVHPGIGLRDNQDRDRMGAGLAGLLDHAARTDLIDEILILVRSVPDDAAERDQWIARHRDPEGPEGARIVNDELQLALAVAAVRSEAYLTLVVPETRLGKAAKDAGRGVDGRAQILYALMAEVETQLKGGMECTSVSWLTSPELAAACRTGFAPGERAGIVDALTAASSDESVNAQVPWAMAGPSGADTAARHYSHDAWNSISATIKLPVKGALLGALAPMLMPSAAGERRSFLVAYPIVAHTRATRQAETNEWAADMGQELRARARVKTGTRTRDEVDQVRAVERKLARGSALTYPYAVCTVTAPKTARIAEHGRRLDAAIRGAGFAPLRLDLAQDRAFAASVVPLGTSLTRRGDT